MSIVRSLLRGLFCGLLSFLLVFVVIPLVFSLPPLLGLPDIVWMALEILLPAGAAVFLLRRTHPAFAWAGLPVQDLLLYLFAKPVSGILGISLDGLSGITYVFDAVVWPLVVTGVQFFVLLSVRKIRKHKV